MRQRKNTFEKHLWSLWLLKKHDLCLLSQRKHLMLPLSLQDRYAGDCGWHCPAEPLVIDTTKTGSKSFLKGAWSKHSNVEPKRLWLRVKKKTEHKSTPPEHSVTISTSHNGQYWKELWGFPPQEMFLLYKDKSHLHTDCKARFMWGFLVWREGFAICILNFFRSVREQAEKQNCSFWAQHLLLLASRMPSSPAQQGCISPAREISSPSSSKQQGQNSATAHRYQET